MKLSNVALHVLLFAVKMDSYHELVYMETSLQILNLGDEIRSLQRKRDDIQRTIDEKLKKQAELRAKKDRFLRIINITKGSGHYSPEKRGVHHPTPKKVQGTQVTMQNPVNQTMRNSSDKTPTESGRQDKPSTSTAHKTLDFDATDFDIGDDELLNADLGTPMDDVLKTVEQSHSGNVTDDSLLDQGNDPLSPDGTWIFPEQQPVGQGNDPISPDGTWIFPEQQPVDIPEEVKEFVRNTGHRTDSTDKKLKKKNKKKARSDSEVKGRKPKD